MKFYLEKALVGDLLILLVKGNGRGITQMELFC